MVKLGYSQWVRDQNRMVQTVGRAVFLKGRNTLAAKPGPHLKFKFVSKGALCGPSCWHREAEASLLGHP